jgi:hypothetical protein
MSGVRPVQTFRPPGSVGLPEPSVPTTLTKAPEGESLDPVVVDVGDVDVAGALVVSMPPGNRSDSCGASEHKAL